MARQGTGKRDRARDAVPAPVVEGRPGIEPAIKIALLVALPVAAVVCGASTVRREAWISDALRQLGFVAWPPSPDDFVWREIPQRSFELVAIDAHGAGALVFVTGFACWMALAGWLLRRTAAPYLLAVASLGFTLLVTGGVRGHGAVPRGLAVDAATGTYLDHGKTGRLCDLRALRVEKRSAARGGPSYWIVADLRDRPAVDLYVLDDAAPAAVLRDEIDALRALGGCGALAPD